MRFPRQLVRGHSLQNSFRDRGLLPKLGQHRLYHGCDWFSHRRHCASSFCLKKSSCILPLSLQIDPCSLSIGHWSLMSAQGSMLKLKIAGLKIGKSGLIFNQPTRISLNHRMLTAGSCSQPAAELSRGYGSSPSPYLLCGHLESLPASCDET